MLMILWMGGYRMLIAKTLSVDLCSTRTINLGGNEETSVAKLAKIVKKLSFSENDIVLSCV